MLFFSGCNHLTLIHSKGEIGIAEKSLIFTAFGLMLIVVVPVIIMTIYFSIKYRSTSTNIHKKYLPHWNNSKKIEFIVWFVPILIIIVLSILTWRSTHKLDPKNPIISSKNETITINVIALDWKWLFIYPEQNIAVINELVFPFNTPIKFNVTSNSVMNAFFIPQLGGQIYAMAGMCTELNLIANEPGKYRGISSNFSGKGFSGMKFSVIATKNKQEFNQWIQKVQNSPYQINNIDTYEILAKPSEYNPVVYYSNIQSNLFYEVINKFNYYH